MDSTRNADDGQRGSILPLIRSTEVGERWKSVEWNEVLKGNTVSDHILMRSGLIRKDLVPRYIGQHTPLTFLCSDSFQLEKVVVGCHTNASCTEINEAIKLCINAPLPPRVPLSEEKEAAPRQQPQSSETVVSLNSNKIGPSFDSTSNSDRRQLLEVSTEDNGVSSVAPLPPPPPSDIKTTDSSTLHEATLHEAVNRLCEENTCKDNGAQQAVTHQEDLGYNNSNPLRPAHFNDFWVIKPSDSSNAYGVQFFHSSQARSSYDGPFKTNLQQAFSGDSKWIIQQYLRPLLVDPTLPNTLTHFSQGGVEGSLGLREAGYKFHIRVLVLVAGVMEVYLYNNARVLIATEQIDSDMDIETLSNGYAHITNRSYNERHERFQETKQNINLTELEAYLGKGIVPDIKNILKVLFRRLSKDRKHFFTLPNAYELFGLDFIVDQGGFVHFLEANPEPSMSMFALTKEQLITCCPLEEKPEGFQLVYSQKFDRFMERLRELKNEARGGDER